VAFFICPGGTFEGDLATTVGPIQLVKRRAATKTNVIKDNILFIFNFGL